MWVSSINAECGLPQCVRIAGRRRLWKLTANTGSVLLPFLCAAVSGSKLLLFGGASDDEQGSNEGDHRRGEFHSFGKILLRT